MSLDAFIRVADTLVEFVANFDDNRYPTDTLHEVDIHRQELAAIWPRVKKAYAQYLHDIDQEARDPDSKSKPVDIEPCKAKYHSTYLSYSRCLAQLSELYDRLRSKTSSPSTSTTDSDKVVETNSNSFHLPPCDIPTFDGCYQTWPTFRDLFEAVYINSSRLSPIEKLLHLTKKTSGEPQKIVLNCPLTNNGFKLAWENLCTEYDNHKVLVNNQIRTVLNLPYIKSESATDIKRLQNSINTCISSLKVYDIVVESWDPLFVLICTDRLPEASLNLWEQSLSDKTSIPKWSQLDTFLSDRYRTLESVSESRKANTSKSSDVKAKAFAQPGSSKKVNAFSNNVSNSNGTNATTKTTNSGQKCLLCRKDLHIFRNCPRFLSMNFDQRFAEVKKQSLCINCFSKAHSVKKCTSQHNCHTCGKRHNTLLHKETSGQDASPQVHPSSNLNPNSVPFTKSIQSTDNATEGVVQSYYTSNSNGVLLGTAMVNVCHLGLRYMVRALVDSGSEGSFVSERLFKLLKLPSTSTSAQISGLNGTISAKSQRQCTMILGAISQDDIQVSITALVVPRVVGNLPSRTVDPAYFSDLPEIQLADPKFYESSSIDILIGGDVLPYIMLSGIKHKVCGSLMAQETIFGWILTGPVLHTPSPSYSLVASFACEISLSKEISRFWVVEDIPRKNFPSPSDKVCEELFVRTTKRNKDGRYMVSLPFKDGYADKLTIGQSRRNALAQFFKNEARLIRNPGFKEEYDQVLEEYVQLDHMSKVDPNLSVLQQYYLPHHAVIKPESTTTKVRVVFNASARSSNGLSLNDILHTGPTLQSDLPLLLHKWRLFRYVFNADIQKMYRQILVTPEHTSFQRILFRRNPQDTVQDYELKTVTFGVNCAPYLAIRTLLQLADDVETEYPLASDILRHSMYVDDALVGAHTVDMAIKLKIELILALKSAGFSLRKWTSNSKVIICDIPTEHLLHGDFLKFDDKSIAKMLGIRWNALSDSFYLTSRPFPESDTYTKREVLSQIAKLFDPAGWLSPCIVLAKIIMQKIWIEGTEWDEALAPDTLAQWINFQSNYSCINQIRIPRWLNYTPDAKVEFHGFCDASERAYASALYIRIELGSSVSVSLVSSKTKVAPIKTLSIPRLELCGALLLAEMIDGTVPNLGVENWKLFCWTDSTIVLSWLAKPPCCWMTFVANRVAKIIEVIDPIHWRHVESESNPADLASRGVPPQDLLENDLWWHGPTWLKTAPDLWPNQITIDCSELEKKPIKVNFAYFQNYEDVLERFSSFSRALRVLTYALRFFYHTHSKFRNRVIHPSVVLSSAEIAATRDHLITLCQKASYPNERNQLSSKGSIPSTSSLLNLNPFMDEDGIMRSCGRLENAPGLSFNEKHPVIIPYNCQFTRLLVKFVHDITLHGGNQLVLRVLRTQFWIPKVKNLIKATIRKCKPCLIYKKRCQRQIMAALPPERSEISRVFTHTGLDFAGPFDIKSYSGRACRITKGYVCVFVCFSTKAIHLEATSDLATPTFLAAFHRFVSRRGCPLHLHSDNGTTFVGASKVLAREFIQTSRDAVTANYAHQNITWHFIPPGAPHMGGLWEAGVKSFKSHFKRVSGSYKYTFEEFSTLLGKIEACLNSRPLSPISQDPSDLSALTPGHFLIGSPILTPIDPTIQESAASITNRWQRLKLVHQHFCLRWKTEYLTELQKRTKWQRPEENLKENTLVVIKEENLPANSWRLGRVTKTHLGPDQRVRVAEVFTQKGLITRPISKLVPLYAD